MKIAVIILNQITAGGGFNQALNAALQIARLSPSRFEFQCYTRHETPVLAQCGLATKPIHLGWSDRIAVSKNSSHFAGQLTRKLSWMGQFERKLCQDGIDLVYFTAPTIYAAALTQLNYIATVWDLCHRDTPEFPEVRLGGEFEAREFIYRNTLAKAFLIMGDSPQLAAKLSSRYGIDLEKILPMPFSPSAFMAQDGNSPSVPAPPTAGYFFYPAQFWPHKNHIRILEALALLKNKNIHARVVFCGHDHGNLKFIKERARQLAIETQLTFLGFVAPEQMAQLYQQALALVMPTYFGPTNIPPLEAWTHHKPVIYSAPLAAQVGDAALLIDPDSATSLAAAMEKMLDAELRADYIARGQQRLAAIAQERVESEALLVEQLAKFSARRRCW